MTLDAAERGWVEWQNRDFNGADDLAHADLSGSKISAEAVGSGDEDGKKSTSMGPTSPYNTHADLSDSTLAAEVAAEGGEKGGIFFNEANLPTTPT